MSSWRKVRKPSFQAFDKLIFCGFYCFNLIALDKNDLVLLLNDNIRVLIREHNFVFPKSSNQKSPDEWGDFYAVSAVLETRGKVGHDAFNRKHLKKEIY